MAILVTYLNFNRASISSTHSIQDPEQKKVMRHLISKLGIGLRPYFR